MQIPAPPQLRRPVVVASIAASAGLAAAASIAASTTPAVAVVTLGGIAALSLVVLRPRYGIVVVLATIMLIPEPFSVAVGPITVSAGRALLWALELGWLLQLARWSGRESRRSSPFHVAVMVAFGAMVLSLVVNLPTIDGFGLLGAIRQLSVFSIDLFFFYFVVHSVVRNPVDVEWLMRAVAALIVFTAVLGLIEYLSGRNVFEFITPHLPSRYQVIFEGIARGSEAGLRRGAISRVRSTFEGPLTFSTVLLLGLPLCLAFAVGARSVADRWRWGAATATVSAALLLTASRAGYVLGALTFLLFVTISPDNRARTQALIAALAMVGVLLSQPAVRDTMTAFFRIEKGGVLEGSLRARQQDHGPVLARVAEKPLFGYAPRSFAPDALMHNHLLGDRTDVTLDNAYLVALAETGVIGLLGLGTLLLATLVSGWRAIWATTERSRRTLCIALFAAMLSWTLMGFAADTYLLGAPPRMFVVLLAALATMRESSGWTRRRETSQGLDGVDISNGTQN